MAAGSESLQGLSRGFATPPLPPRPIEPVAPNPQLSELLVEVRYLRRDADEQSKALKEARSDYRSDLKELRADISALKTDAGTLKDRVGQLPSYEKMVVTISALLALFAAIILYGDKIKAAIHP